MAKDVKKPIKTNFDMQPSPVRNINFAKKGAQGVLTKKKERFVYQKNK
jgi:hypothetical protein